MKYFNLEKRNAEILNLVLGELFRNKRHPGDPESLERIIVDLMMEEKSGITKEDLSKIVYWLSAYQLKISPAPYGFDGGEYIWSIGTITRSFLDNGGFLKIFEDEEEENELKRQIAQVNASVIETNRSVQKVNRLFWITLVFAGMAGIFEAATFIRDTYKDSKHSSDKVDAQLIPKKNLSPSDTTSNRLSISSDDSAKIGTQKIDSLKKKK